MTGFGQHLRHEICRYIHQRVVLLNTDGADGVTGNIGVVSNCAYDIVGPYTVHFTGAEGKPHHACFV